MQFLRVLILLCTLLSGFSSLGQTTRYWSLNFASEPSLLAGAVLGGYAENQAVYYNPAIIHESEVNNISFSGDMIGMDFYSAKNAFGTEIDLKKSQFNLLPNFISFYVRSKRNPDLSFQAAAFTRDKNDIDLVRSRNGKADIYQSIPGDESYSVLYESQHRFSDVWIGGGGSYKVSDRFSVGISSFISVKKLDDKETKSINVSPTPGSLGDSTSSEFVYTNTRELSRISILNIRMQFKIGLQYRMGNWSMGANLTLPSFSIYSDAERFREVGGNSIYDDRNQEVLGDFIIMGGKRNIPGMMRDPLSIAAGFNYTRDGGKNMFGISAEYFAEIAEYKMIDGSSIDIISEPFDFDNDLFMSVRSAAKPVLNVAIGGRRYINPKLTLIGGFRTDFDYLKDVSFEEGRYANHSSIRYYFNVFHFSGGARFNISRHKFIAGAQYSLGREDNVRQLADFTPEFTGNVPDNPIEDLEESKVSLAYNGISLYVGFIFNFSKKSNTDTPNGLGINR